MNQVIKIASKIGISLTSTYSKDCRGRFWILNCKNFFAGTSLNGIGKKISLINLLPDSDVEEIVRLLRANNLIKQEQKLMK